MPAPETGTRIVKQLLRLGQGVAMLNRSPILGDHEFQILRKVVMDSLPSRRCAILGLLASAGKRFLKVDELRATTKLPATTLRYALEEMELLGITKNKTAKVGATRETNWALTKEFQELFQRLDRFRRVCRKGRDNS